MKPRFLPKFPIFVQDWLSSLRVRSMTSEERGGFLELLLLQWQEGGLPENREALLRLSGIQGLPSDHPLVMDAFPVCGDGLRRNDKCARVRTEAEAWCESQSEKGKKGAAARWDGTGHARANARAMTQNGPPTPTPTPTPISDSEENKPSPPAPATVPRIRKPPSGDNADCIRHWESEWMRTRLGQTWSWQQKDAVLMSKALKAASGDAHEVRSRTTRLLEHGDAWMAENASPGLLVSRWNQLALTVVPNGKPTALDAVAEYVRRREAR